MQCLISHTVFFSNDFFISGACTKSMNINTEIQQKPVLCVTCTVVKPGLFASSPRLPSPAVSLCECVCLDVWLWVLLLCVCPCQRCLSVCWERAQWNPNIWVHTWFWGGHLNVWVHPKVAETALNTLFSLVVVSLCIISWGHWVSERSRTLTWFPWHTHFISACITSECRRCDKSHSCVITHDIRDSIFMRVKYYLCVTNSHDQKVLSCVLQL